MTTDRRFRKLSKAERQHIAGLILETGSHAKHKFWECPDVACKRMRKELEALGWGHPTEAAVL